MLDIKFIRENPNKVKEGCLKKRVKVDIDELLDVDKRKRETLQALEDMRAQKNKANKEIQQAKGQREPHSLFPLRSAVAELGSQREKNKIILKMRELDSNSDRLAKTLKELDKKFNNLILQIPNLPLDDVPVGQDERDNVVLREVGKKPKFDFQSKDYMEIAQKFDLIDTERAAKVAGTRFGYIKREAVLLEFALINLAFEVLLKEKFIPVIPPVMLKDEMARGMGYLEQTDKEEAYFLPQDNLYLVGTSEQSVGAMHAGELFKEEDLPRRYVGFSTCFRREAGSYGRDTKGILRVHQFDKVEMFSFCKPEDSREEHQLLLKMEEKLMKLLKIPYRVVQLCTGDLGRPSVATFDIESWFPVQGQYRETHSTSNCTDFQARRLNIRYQKKDGKLDFVHTLNGTAFAIGRILIAIIENFQQKDGSILIPEALQKYLNFNKITR